MSLTSPDDPECLPTLSTIARRFNDPFITSALGFDDSPRAPKSRAITGSKARRQYAGLLWLHDRQAALDFIYRSNLPNSQIVLEILRVQLLDILDPQWPTWAYFAIYLFFGVFAVIGVAPLSSTGPMCSTLIACLPILLFRIYHTFRTRILASLGYRRPERHSPRVHILVTTVKDYFAVGQSAFRDAPLAQAWYGMTGKERTLSQRQRDLILHMVIIVIDFILLPSILAFIIRTLLQLARITLAPRIGSFEIGINYHLFSFKLTQLSLGQLQRLADFLGYRWQDRDPLFRGFTDQMLATYQLPNPTRDADLARDASTAACATSDHLAYLTRIKSIYGVISWLGHAVMRYVWQ